MTKRVLSIEQLYVGSIWRLPEVNLPVASCDYDMDLTGYEAGTIIELVSNRNDVDDDANYVFREGTITCDFRVLFGSVPEWWMAWINGHTVGFALTMPITQEAADNLLFVPTPIEQYR